jgi:hypothetical protein
MPDSRHNPDESRRTMFCVESMIAAMVIFMRDHILRFPCFKFLFLRRLDLHRLSTRQPPSKTVVAEVV